MNQGLACTLTSTELKLHKGTALARLKAGVLERKELVDGVALRFAGSDRMMDDLVAFIKAERVCCSFFTFTLSVEEDQNPIWLTIRGPEGAKDFLSSELGL